MNPIVSLNQSKKYLVRRIGISTDKVTQGIIYECEYKNVYQDQYAWVIEHTNRKNMQTQPVLRVKSTIWRVLRSIDGTDVINSETLDEKAINNVLLDRLQTTPETEEKIMPSQFHSISTGRMINTECASKRTDREVIDFIKDQRNQRKTLAEEVGEESKYFKSKAKDFDANIKLLTAELESRA